MPVDNPELISAGVVIQHPETSVIYGSRIGRGTKIGARVTIGGAIIGQDCNIMDGVYIPPGVIIGDRVFIGAGTTFTNDKYPSRKQKFVPEMTLVEDDVSIGVNCSILCGLTIEAGARIGMGSVVTKNVAPNTTVFGVSAQADWTRPITENLRKSGLMEDNGR